MSMPTELDIVVTYHEGLVQIKSCDSLIKVLGFWYLSFT